MPPPLPVPVAAVQVEVRSEAPPVLSLVPERGGASVSLLIPAGLRAVLNPANRMPII